MAVSLVQQTAAIVNSGASPAVVTLPANTTTGNLVVVKICGCGGSGDNFATVNPSLTNSFVAAVHVDSSSNGFCSIWYLANCGVLTSTSITSITYTLGSGMRLFAWAEEWSGLATSSPLDQTGTATGAGTSIPVATSSAAQASDMATSCYSCHFTAATTDTITQGTGFTLNSAAQSQGASGNNHVTGAYNANTGSAGTVTDAATQSAAANQGSQAIATFSQTGAAAAVAVPHVISQYSGMF